MFFGYFFLIKFLKRSIENRSPFCFDSGRYCLSFGSGLEVEFVCFRRGEGDGDTCDLRLRIRAVSFFHRIGLIKKQPGVMIKAELELSRISLFHFHFPVVASSFDLGFWDEE